MKLKCKKEEKIQLVKKFAHTNAITLYHHFIGTTRVSYKMNNVKKYTYIVIKYKKAPKNLYKQVGKTTATPTNQTNVRQSGRQTKTHRRRKLTNFRIS